jgi:4-hydroxybutyrate CoA-transferase
LIEAGVVTGKFKNLNPGKVVGALLIGTERLYRFCDRNPLIELYSVAYTHNRSIVSQLDNFVSINSAIEVDLTGQVNSGMINGKQLAGVGGQVDFARIARLSKGGISIIAIPSIANGKTKIVPKLAEVSATRTDADYVITEYGIAHLRYRSLRERAKALMQIAHPDFRKDLSYWGQKV